MTLYSKLARLGLGVLFSVVAAQPVQADLAEWDQERVTEIAQELAEAAGKWRQAVREQPAGQLGSGFGGDGLQSGESAQRLEEQSRALAAQLGKGKGRDETHGLYMSLKEIADDSEVQARGTDLGEPGLDAWSKVADLLRQLAPYYDPKAQAS